MILLEHAVPEPRVVVYQVCKLSGRPELREDLPFEPGLVLRQAPLAVHILNYNRRRGFGGAHGEINPLAQERVNEVAGVPDKDYPALYRGRLALVEYGNRP